jgi:hypothetical protein
MNRVKACSRQRELIEFVESIEEYRQGYPVTVTLHTEDIEAMRQGCDDMMKIDGLKTYLFPEEKEA